jgi:hypothetical protein
MIEIKFSDIYQSFIKWMEQYAISEALKNQRYFLIGYLRIKKKK